jgi:all-trans-retinol dehydrogenase (NAD+)
LCIHCGLHVAQGIGRLIAFEFARRGARLILWDLDGALLDQTALELRSKFPAVSLRTYVCDLSKRDQIYATALQVQAADGHPDVVVNNAGVVSGTLFLDTADAKNELTFQVNVMAHLWMAKAFLPKMVERNSGNFASVSSIASFVAAPGMVRSLHLVGCRSFGPCRESWAG